MKTKQKKNKTKNETKQTLNHTILLFITLMKLTLHLTGTFLFTHKH